MGMNFFFKRTDFALDIGSKHVRVFEADKGVVLDASIEDLVDEATFRDRGERLAAVCHAAFVRVGARRRFVSRIKRVLLSVPSGIGEVEKRAYEDAARGAGASVVFLVESPMAAAIGAGCEVSNAKATTVIDIGASHIQAVVISLAGIVAVRETARTENVSPDRLADLVRTVISDCLAKGCYNLVDDIARYGIVLTGGGAQTPGIADALQTALNLPVQIADDPQLAVIEGAGVVLGQLDGLRRSRAKTRPIGRGY
jgi:actin-like ATPase involved in cell morphogenesis